MYADVIVLLLGKGSEKLDSIVALIMAVQYCHSKDLVVNKNKIAAHKWEEKKRTPETTWAEEISHKEWFGVTLDGKSISHEYNILTHCLVHILQKVHLILFQAKKSLALDLYSWVVYVCTELLDWITVFSRVLFFKTEIGFDMY